MFIPIGDSPNPRHYTPWVSWAIIAVNVLIYLFITIPLSHQGVSMDNPLLHQYLRAIVPELPPGVTVDQVLSHISAYDLYTFLHGYKPGAPKIGDLFYSMFLHGGILHLAGNMLFLWIYGNNVEFSLGKIGFILTYLSTGALATLFFSFFADSSMTPLVGASGAISGVLGVYFLLFPRNKVKMFIALIPFYVDVLLLPARWVLGFYIVIDNLLPLLVSRQSGGIAYGAHIGGFIGGMAIAFIGERFSWHWPWRDSMWRVGSTRARASRAAEAEDSPHLASVRAAMAGNYPEEAVDILTHMDSREVASLSPNECIILSQWLDESGHPIAASRLLRQCISTRRKSEPLADIYLSLGLMRLRQGQPTAAYQYLLAVLENNPSKETERRARDALRGIDIHRSAR